MKIPRQMLRTAPRATRIAARIAALLAVSTTVGQPAMSQHAKLIVIPFTDVKIEDDFWAPRMKINRQVTLDHIWKMCEQTGRLANFTKAAGRAEGKHEGFFFNDSDVYKMVEGAADILALNKDEQLDKRLDDLIATIAAAQQPDGYLNTFYTLTDPNQRWTNLKDKHELYCGGHLIEAGVAHWRATGKRTLLDVAIKFADHVDSLFGPDKRRDVCGHPEIELALIKLFDATGEKRYFDLAKFFIDERGHANGRSLYGEYCQDHKPIREHDEIVGHAVRAMYLYSAAADVAAHTGDKELIAALERIWTDLTTKKMYITGGIGSSAHNEGFTTAYDLPNETAYAETCAAIGLIYFSHRMNLLTGDAKYVDVLERVLYNGFLSSVSLEGDKFFYVNPLASRGRYQRKPWYDCACCPPNILRTMATLGQYIYGKSGDAIYVNLFVDSTAKINIRGTAVTVRQRTNYPWDGKLRIEVEPERPVTFELRIRAPRYPLFTIEGASQQQQADGYMIFAKEWHSGDFVAYGFGFPIERVQADPQVKANVGRIALQRGPIVYCAESEPDGAGRVRSFALPREAKLTTQFRKQLLGGVLTVTGRLLDVRPAEYSAAGTLYRPADNAIPVEFAAIPYFAWANREPGDMLVWIPESPSLVEPPPAPGIKAAASHCYGSDSIDALFDRKGPAGSGDHSIPRFTWWPRKGSNEWVSYEFERPRRLSHVEVYWFDDGAKGGGCRVPASWSLHYRDGDDWKPVHSAGEFGTKPDTFNSVAFDEVETNGLKLEAQLKDGFSAGILEWRVSGSAASNDTATTQPAAARGRGPLRGTAADDAATTQPVSAREPGQFDAALREELLARLKEDQRIRLESPPGLLDWKKAAEWRKIDADNTAYMKTVIEKHGWPGRSLVGGDGALAAFMLVQHADADAAFQRKCLPLLTEAVARHEARPQDMALLTDRVLVGQGKPQRFGSQLHTVNGELRPFPIEDEAEVDARRREVGLQPLEEYVRQLRATERR